MDKARPVREASETLPSQQSPHLMSQPSPPTLPHASAVLAIRAIIPYTECPARAQIVPLLDCPPRPPPYSRHSPHLSRPRSDTSPTITHA